MSLHQTHSQMSLHQTHCQMLFFSLSIRHTLKCHSIRHTLKCHSSVSPSDTLSNVTPSDTLSNVTPSVTLLNVILQSLHQNSNTLFYSIFQSHRQLLNPASGRCLGVTRPQEGATVSMEICDQWDQNQQFELVRNIWITPFNRFNNNFQALT